MYPDFMWAMLAVYMNKFDDSVELNTINPELVEKANMTWDFIHKSSKENGRFMFLLGKAFSGTHHSR